MVRQRGDRCAFGTTVVLPPNLPHTWKNISDATGRMMAVVTPGGFEHFFIELERTGANTPEAILPIQKRFGLCDVEMEAELQDQDRHLAVHPPVN